MFFSLLSFAVCLGFRFRVRVYLILFAFIRRLCHEHGLGYNVIFRTQTKLSLTYGLMV